MLTVGKNYLKEVIPLKNEKKKSGGPPGRPKLKPGQRNVYQLTLWKYLKKESTDDKAKPKS